MPRVDLEDSGTSDRAYELADQVEHITFRLAGQGDADRFATAAGLQPEEQQRRTRPVMSSGCSA